MPSVPAKPSRPTRPADGEPGEADAQAEPRLELSLSEVWRLLRRRYLVVLAVGVLFAIVVVAIHLRFPPWVEGEVTLQIGLDVGRSLQRSGETLDETFLKEREEVVQFQLKKLRDKNPSNAEGILNQGKNEISEGASGVVRDSMSVRISRCELPSATPRQIVVVAEGAKSSQVLELLQVVSASILQDHQQKIDIYRERWKKHLDVADRELERWGVIRKNLNGIEPEGEREQALKSISLDLLNSSEASSREKREEALKWLRLSPDSLTVRLREPTIIGPVGVRSLPLMLLTGIAGGVLLGSLIGLAVEVRDRRRKTILGTAEKVADVLAAESK